MNRKTIRMQKHHSVGDLYLFVLFGMLAIFSLMIVILGARVYHNVVSVTEQNNQVRSSVLYLTNKVRSSDQTGSIDVTEYNGISVLQLSNIYETANYSLLIYYSDGAIRELLTDTPDTFDPSQGDIITSASGFSASVSDNLLSFSVISEDGNVYDMHIALQSSQTR